MKGQIIIYRRLNKSEPWTVFGNPKKNDENGLAEARIEVEHLEKAGFSTIVFRGNPSIVDLPIKN